MSAHHPLSEARAVAGDGFAPTVLESSPPAVTEEPWFADDPAVPRPGVEGTPLRPVSAAGATWDALCMERPELAGWCADRWLGAWRRLPDAPHTLHESRLALHRLAAYVISPWRRERTGRIGLRWTRGGFGTPFTGPDDAQVRVTRDGLVAQVGARATEHPFTSLRSAASALGIEPDVGAGSHLDVPPPGDLDAPLPVDPRSVDFVGDWFGFVTSVLEQIRAEADAHDDPGRVQLWPEHFDAGLDLGAGDARATFGGSPGDEDHPDPYLYVAPWTPPESDAFWNAIGFEGRSLTWGELRMAEDQRELALAFMRTCRDYLTGAAGVTPGGRR